MLDKYVVFDVETPNSFNDRMSAIGIVVVEDGRIVEEFSTLVNPEAKFHSFHMQLTGITPEDVKSAPTFPELWLAIEPLFRDRLCIAHNAPFDMSVLAKCLQHYQISWRESADYACTCQMGRRCCPELPNHKLNTMCNHLGIPLDHTVQEVTAGLAGHCCCTICVVGWTSRRLSAATICFVHVRYQNTSSGGASENAGDRSGGCLIWDNGKFMICQRPPHKMRGMLWEFVGGKVERESPRRKRWCGSAGRNWTSEYL